MKHSINDTEVRTIVYVIRFITGRFAGIETTCTVHYPASEFGEVDYAISYNINCRAVLTDFTGNDYNIISYRWSN
ncbi:hypothetical protein EVB81_095 [Rhizobium phage RHph_I46]|uniref:Uncharacterized protein n=1 Tax=Rhizobium phage RHph_I1_9 TaxID=2509729 RepID=A0A7S5RDL4_9CAUD|nr:hypothetical protein PP936_gp094 [Rhizobium phage RHph_I1_9]QIG69664.1 hypothetical protein EVB81_095 [Rhizobium phage RHph_I46]QIG70945.1 hypothetical protein EVB92_095 [Rhizobium phage RHph_I9]QIG73531.1 hypothetical protein EVC04_094 [Rhizobium phage RHph_I1_9]QIG76284.1 hypothetical protein EVC25_095 [Rhizobium phage RHph_I34]